MRGPAPRTPRVVLQRWKRSSSDQSSLADFGAARSAFDGDLYAPQRSVRIVYMSASSWPLTSSSLIETKRWTRVRTIPLPGKMLGILISGSIPLLILSHTAPAQVCQATEPSLPSPILPKALTSSGWRLRNQLPRSSMTSVNPCRLQSSLLMKGEQSLVGLPLGR